MIVDLVPLITFLTNDLVISGVLAFVTGMVSVMVYGRVKSALAGRHYKEDGTVVEAVVLEYTRRLRDYDKMIADLRAKIDIMEARSSQSAPPQPVTAMSQPGPASQQPQNHVAAVSEPVAVTQQQQHVHATTASMAVADGKEGNNGTTDYILKLLAEKPRTSREVQLAVGRTREHTARLMKKLHDAGLVSRDVNTKPFRYNITDAGRERLKERVAPAAV